MSSTFNKLLNNQPITFAELVQKETLEQILAHVACSNVVDDRIITIKPELNARPSSCMGKPDNVPIGDWCIAGSSALHPIVSALQNQPHVKGAARNKPLVDAKVWQPADTDIFVLNAKQPNRLISGSLWAGVHQVDLVHVTETSIADLLLNFDLPCSRAAYDAQYNWYLSFQCLSAIVKGFYYLPAYMAEEKAFIGKFRMCRSHLDSHKAHPVGLFLYGRLRDRITKYQTRGFNVRFLEIWDTVPWMKNRFTYAEVPKTDSAKPASGVIIKPVVSNAKAAEATQSGLVIKPAEPDAQSKPMVDALKAVHGGEYVSISAQPAAQPAPRADCVEIQIRIGDIGSLQNLCKLGFVVVGVTPNGVMVTRAA